MRGLAPACLLVLVSACATPMSVGPAGNTQFTDADVRSGRSCGADKLASWIGRKSDDAAIVSLRSWRGADHPLRVLEPGAIATTDYRPDRLNLDVDAEGRILRAYCS